MGSIWYWIKKHGLLVTGAVIGGAVVGGPLAIAVGAGLGAGADWWRAGKSPALPPPGGTAQDPVVKAAGSLGKLAQRPKTLGPTDNRGVK